MKNSTIYKIESQIKPKRCYIGSAVDVRQRWRAHLHLLRNNKQPNKKLQNHYNKYGEEDLIFSILLGCEKEDLIKTEQYFIDSYNPWFNICIKADSQFGLKRSDESKRKISESKKGCIPWNKGKTGIYSEETLRKIGTASIGRILPDEHKKKIANSMKGKQNCLGNKLSENHKTNIGNSLRGKKYKTKVK